MTILDWAVIFFMAAGTLLFVILAVGLVVLFPSLRRILANVEETSGKAAEVWGNLAEVSQSIKEAASEIISNTVVASKNVARLTESAKKTADDVSSVTGDLANAAPETMKKVQKALDEAMSLTARATEIARIAKESFDNIRTVTARASDATKFLEVVGGPQKRAAFTLRRIASFLRGAILGRERA